MQDAAQAGGGPGASAAADAGHVKRRGRPCKAKEENKEEKSSRSFLHVFMGYMAPATASLPLPNFSQRRLP